MRASYRTYPFHPLLRRATAVARSARGAVSGGHRPAVADAVAVALIAVALYALFRGGFPTNDSWHTLLWGAELASGRLPDYEAPLAPTPHPLLILYAAALSPFLGTATEQALQLTGMIAVGAVAVGLFRLGTRLYAWPVGLLAAAILLTRDRFLYLGARGSVAMVALALVTWAVVLEAGRPRRGWPVLALLLLAGLLRPEAWLLSAAYWLWLVPAVEWRARVGLGALAAAAPLLWALSDFLVTGDPLWSLHGTQDLAGTLDRPTGLSVLPESTWRIFRSLLEPLAVIAGVCGLVAGLMFRDRATRLPAAVFALQGVAYVGLAAFELPLNQGYLLPAAMILSLFAAVAGLGWVALPSSGRVRAVWRPLGIVAIVVMAAMLIWQLPSANSVRGKLVARGAFGAELQALLASDAVERAVAQCGPVISPSNFRRPQIAYLTGRSEESVAVAKGPLPPEEGVYIRAATRPEVGGRVNGYGPGSFKDFRRDRGPPEALSPQGYSQIARGRFWNVYSRCNMPGSSADESSEPRSSAGAMEDEKARRAHTTG